MKNKGFTLVEFLIAFGIIAVISSTVLSILFITFRLSKKSDVLVELKQDGSAALSQVARQIRYAKSLDDTDPPTGADQVTCAAAGSNLSSIKITSSSDEVQTYECTTGTNATITSNNIPLVDTGSTIVSSCSFTCKQSTPNDPPTIGISFTLSPRNASLVETTGTIPFQTSVTMRNFSR